MCRCGDVEICRCGCGCGDVDLEMCRCGDVVMWSYGDVAMCR